MSDKWIKKRLRDMDNRGDYVVRIGWDERSFAPLPFPSAEWVEESSKCPLEVVLYTHIHSRALVIAPAKSTRIYLNFTK
jgi:hypothetical protein